MRMGSNSMRAGRNYERRMRMMGGRKRRKSSARGMLESRLRYPNVTRAEINRTQRMRTPWARHMDAKKTSKYKVDARGTSEKARKAKLQWMRDPGSMDIRGVDTRGRGRARWRNRRGRRSVLSGNEAHTRRRRGNRYRYGSFI